MRKRQERVVAQLRTWGWEVTRERGNHWRIVDPRSGAFVLTISCSPSDYRTQKNELARMKKLGVWMDIKEAREVRVSDRVPIPQVLQDRLERVVNDLGYRPGVIGRTNSTMVDLVRHGNTLVANGGWKPPSEQAGADFLRRVYRHEAKTTQPGMFEWLSNLINDVDRGGTLPPKPVARTRNGGLKVFNGGVVEEKETPKRIPGPERKVHERDGFPLYVRVLAAILDPTVTRAEALALAEEVRTAT